MDLVYNITQQNSSRETEVVILAKPRWKKLISRIHTVNLNCGICLLITTVI